MDSLLHDLGIEPGALVVNIVSFLLLLLLMKRFVFGPVGSALEERKRHVVAAVDSAEAARAEAQTERDDVKGRRDEMMQVARDAAEAAKQEAAAAAQETKIAARDAARQIERSARGATQRDRQEAAGALRREAGQTAAAMCSRILRGTLTEERHHALVDQFIADIENMAADQPPTQ